MNELGANEVEFKLIRVHFAFYIIQQTVSLLLVLLFRTKNHALDRLHTPCNQCKRSAKAHEDTMFIC